MRISFVMCGLAVAACGNDHGTAPSRVDAAAAMADASPLCPAMLESCSGVCVNTTIDMKNCGSCGHECTPAQNCATSACVCPGMFIDPAQPSVASQMLAPPAPGYVTGAIAVTGSDSLLHSVAVTAAATAPLRSALAMNGQVFVGVGYELVSATQARSTYLATAGTVTLTRRCAAGLGGTMANVTLVEVDPTTFAAIPGGCTTSISKLAFDIAGPCV
jgi:hypothetical protein